ncbi:RNA polymerase sigma factor [Gracilibacillus sp. YIM 98692]|uniref:RNA polymerase sigma factor n=1 Tax=Gracilibacillus sp. YIM 98692 TaxID=2663532 RepID=UPI0013D24AE7|nr:RNA polymerase sigma factor [Gracilibacillus sp. YIM 98692]
MYEVMERKESSICLEDIFLKYKDMMYYKAKDILHDPQLAEDAVQEAFIKMYRRGIQVENLNKIPAWLKTVITRTAIDMLRKEQRSHAILLQEDIYLEELMICSAYSVDEKVDYQATVKEITGCIGKCSSKIKQVFYLKFVKGYKVHEIAEALHISHAAVKTRLFRARQILKQQYQINVEKKSEQVKPGA